MTTPRYDPDFPNRPQHDDFFALADEVRTLDELGDKGISLEDIAILSGFDLDSLLYMANQRALRANKLFADSPAPQEAKLSANWIDGFMAGLRLGKKRAQADPAIVVDFSDGQHRARRNE